jgi:hypothetical protein
MNYWGDKSLIVINDEEKKKILQYEISMLHQAYDESVNLNQKTIFQNNLLVECFVIHARVLIDFFLWQ